jgi:hypothetical protein
MRRPLKQVSPREVVGHLLNGAALGTFLALALILANATILGAIVQSPHPKLAVLAFVVGTACLVAVGSAISGFIMSALDKS